MTRYRYTISLRVRHPSLTAQAIRAALSLEPGGAWSVGAPRFTPRGAPLEGHYRESYCWFPIDDGVDGLPAALADAAERLEPQREALREIRATGGHAEFFVGWFLHGGNSGDTLDPALLARLADLGLALALDLYPDLD